MSNNPMLDETLETMKAQGHDITDPIVIAEARKAVAVVQGRPAVVIAQTEVIAKLGAQRVAERGERWNAVGTIVFKRVSMGGEGWQHFLESSPKRTGSSSTRSAMVCRSQRLWESMGNRNSPGNGVSIDDVVLRSVPIAITRGVRNGNWPSDQPERVHSHVAFCRSRSLSRSPHNRLAIPQAV